MKKIALFLSIIISACSQKEQSAPILTESNRELSVQKLQMGFVCTCSPSSNRFKVISQQSGGGAGAQAWLIYSHDSVFVDHYEPVNLAQGYDTIQISHSPFTCNQGYLFLVKGAEPINDGAIYPRVIIAYNILSYGFACDDCSGCGL